MSKLKVGIVGLGRIGCEHATWLSKCSTIHATAVFDPTESRITKAHSLGLIPHVSLTSLLSSDIDIVLVSTPTVLHCEQALEAIAAGKHVMVEKPMSMDLPQATRMVDHANVANRILSVFHNRRWDVDFLTVKSAIESGMLGRVFNIESRLGQWASCVGPAAKDWRPGWRNEAAYGGGGLYDWGSHLIDQIVQLLLPAKPLCVFAQMQGNVWSHDCDDFARVCIDFDNGCSAMVEINTTTAQPLPRWHIDGTLGSAQSPPSLSFDTTKWAEFKFAPGSGQPTVSIPSANAGLNEIQIWEQFAAAVRYESPPAVTAKSVLATMALLDAARESAVTHSRIDLT